MYFCLISFNTKHSNRKWYWSFSFPQIPHIRVSLGKLGLCHLPVFILSLWLLVTTNKALPIRAHGYFVEASILTRYLFSSTELTTNGWASHCRACWVPVAPLHWRAHLASHLTGDSASCQGFYPVRRRRLISIGIPIINLRRSSDRLRFIMGIPIPVRRRLLCE